jgi:hypothetical protein
VRFDSPVQFVHRTVLEELEVDGQRLAPGDVVMTLLAAANRDPARFTDPDRFDVTRPAFDNRHLTFGAGIHYCLGVNLARAELQEALTFLAPRMPGLRLDGEAQIGSINGVYGIDALPLAWGAAR